MHNQNDGRRHYTYILTEPDTNLFYIGVRSCKCDPINDINYKGSMSYWKPDKSKLVKHIIDEYSTRYEANMAEIFMLTLQLKAIKNPLCMNAHIPSVGYCSYGKHPIGTPGRKHTEETKMKIAANNRIRFISDETKKKMSESLKGHVPANKGLPSPNRGIPRSEEIKNKISLTIGLKTKEEKAAQYKKIWESRWNNKRMRDEQPTKS